MADLRQRKAKLDPNQAQLQQEAAGVLEKVAGKLQSTAPSQVTHTHPPLGNALSFLPEGQGAQSGNIWIVL